MALYKNLRNFNLAIENKKVLAILVSDFVQSI